ncbi:MAG: sulfatase-like hydrolase/transferase [Lentisphaerae bacterium]|nr:sulfatase-like hydrolase/transferase [Lentisphaerota bacterium]
MRILYIDIDTLRPDHLGCYGYHRNTSPNIDRLAAEGVRFDNCYVSDAPCLPSRAALYSGQCGIRNGAINHGGAAADLFSNPDERLFQAFGDNFTNQIRRAGYYSVTVSPFGERHSSFWFYNGFREMYNTGNSGNERADEILPVALDWLERKGKEDHWYLHVNFWDPHTGYRTPEAFGNPFENDPPPAWMTEDLRCRTWNTYGPGCAQEPGGDYLFDKAYAKYTRMPAQIDSLAAYKKWVDGYDCGIAYADKHVGLLLDKLSRIGVLNDTLIIISSDHGESLGELSVYGDHQAADHITNRVPLIIRHPSGLGGKGRADKALYYQFDWAASLIEMLGGVVPQSWDGKSFLEAFQSQKDGGRPSLVLSNCAWACQRAVRWENMIMIRTYHSGFKNYPELMLFDIERDPHEIDNLAAARSGEVDKAMRILDAWTAEEMRRSKRAEDPLWTVMREGGPYHARFNSPGFEQYLQRLRGTGRSHFAKILLERRNALITWPH